VNATVIVTCPCCEDGSIEVELLWCPQTPFRAGCWDAQGVPHRCPTGHRLTEDERALIWDRAQEVADQRPAPLEEPQLWDCEELQ
jgi:hypothetical protein